MQVQKTFKGLFINSGQDKTFQSCETLSCFLFLRSFSLSTLKKPSPFVALHKQARGRYRNRPGD